LGNWREKVGLVSGLDGASATGIICGEQHMSPAEFDDAVLRAASGLKAAGVDQDDCVAIFLQNDIPFLIASQAAGRLGAYAVPVNWHLAGEELTYILNDCEAKILVIHANLWHRVKADIPDNIPCVIVEFSEDMRALFNLSHEECAVPAGQINWADWLAEMEPITEAPKMAPSSMLYTSGTTGHPKGVRRALPTPEVAKAAVDFRSRNYGCRKGVRSVIPGPLYHSAPNSYAIQSARIGELVVIMPRYDSEEFLRLVDTYKLTGAVMVPIMFIRLLKLPEEVRQKYDLSSMEFVIHAAAPCPVDVKRQIIDWFGPVINEFYGSTESGAVTLCTSEHSLAYPGTVGKVVAEADMRILDENGNILPPGQIGEIYTRFDMYQAFDYNKRSDERAKIDIDGYITSGDMGYINEEGYVFIADRAKDMVISGGVNIYPAEIEAVLHNFPHVKDCAVFGIPDEEFGESLLAVVEPDGETELQTDAIIAYLREHLAGYKVPRRIEFGRDLPREDSGKIFKRRLRDAYWQEAGRTI